MQQSPWQTFVKNRFLLRELVTRDVQTRYIGSIVGFFWSILNPLVQLALYTVIFAGVLEQRFGEDGSTGTFALYLFCALLPWMSIQEAVTRSSRTFIENSNLIKKVHFPLPVLPCSLTISAFIHQCIGTAVLLLVLVFNQALSYETCFLLLFLFALQLILMYGLSLAAACLNVFFRDIAQLLGVLFMIFFWMTPIVYPKTKAPGLFRWILELNPLTHMVEAYRFVLLGSPRPSIPGVFYWVACCFLALCAGHVILRRTRKELVDLV